MSTRSEGNNERKSRLWVARLYGVLLMIIVVLAGTGNLSGILGAIHRVPLGDKIAHFVLVGLLAYAVNVSVPGRVFRYKKFRYGRLTVSQGTWWVLAVVVLEEISQYWLPSRNFDLGDLLADVLGIGFFSWLALRHHTTPG